MIERLISVIVATYNREDALDAVLRGLSRQRDRGFEIVVADDGSGVATRDVVDAWRSHLAVPITHVWHPDRGFRLSEIRNRAILAACGDFCIFLDGDSIPRGDFIAAYRELNEPGWFVSGQRVLLDEKLTSEVLEKAIEVENWSARNWIPARRTGGANRLLPLVRLHLGPLRKLQAERWQSARGGNIGVRTEDLHEVDGFDARFNGWGREDSDIVLRLMRNGVRRKDGRFATGVVHLWHKESDRNGLAGNERLLADTVVTGRVRALVGVSRLSAQCPVQATPESAPHRGNAKSAPPSRLALAIVSLFPGGGLQRDCMTLARMLRARGHDVTIFTSRKAKEARPDAPVVVLPNKPLTNHGRNLRFARDIQRRSGEFELLVGFDKLPNLDVLYCADPPILSRAPGPLRILPRYAGFLRLEAASFRRGQKSQILLLDQHQAAAYRNRWATEPKRIHVLTPSIERSRRHPEMRTDGTRERVRKAFGAGPETLLLLAVGVQPFTKGHDRIVRALAGVANARLIVAGVGEDDPHWRPLLRAAARAGVSGRIRPLGHREDIPEVMASADLLVHPARKDTTGTVLLEALINGLPIITTAVCGFAAHVKAAQAGIVISEPFAREVFLHALREAADPQRRAEWSRAGALYGERPELYRGLDQAVGIIDDLLRARVANASNVG